MDTTSARTTFMSSHDWCAERTNHPREVAEMALAHAIGDKVEAAYRRGNPFEERRRLMKDSTAFCARSEIRKGSVISMNATHPRWYLLEYHGGRVANLPDGR